MSKGLYLHIPFCKTRCHYCNFVTTAEPAQELRERFFACLFREIGNARQKHGNLCFNTLYLGGGTPSCLDLSEMERLLEAIRAKFDFSAGYEFTCEFNPGDGDVTKLRKLRELGVNRISLGCQAFQDILLQKIGRRHTVRDIIETVSKIRGSGIANISFDLMLRLPGQTLEHFRESLDQCIRLGASQISLYDLEVHGETRLGGLDKEGKLDLPGEEDHARMYEAAIRILTPAGYEHYEISNFAKPGMASRHNLIYWHNQEYLGIGPGAFTYLNGIRSQFAPDLHGYLEKCEAQDWKNSVEDSLSEVEKETETLVTGLRLREGVVPQAFPKIHLSLRDRLETLCKEGFIEKSGENLRLTTRGQFLSEDVFAFLLQKDPSSKITAP